MTDLEESMELESNNFMEREDSGLTTVLAELQQKDKFFDHNVPLELREKLDDFALRRHVVGIYVEEHFYIDDPEIIKREVERGDVVIKKGEYVEKESILEENAEGVFHKMREGQAVVRFPIGTWHMNPKNLILYGHVGGVFRPQKTFPETVVDKLDLKKGDLVRYCGRKIVEKQGYQVPDRMPGIVVDKYPDGLDIVWIKDDEVNQQRFVLRGYAGYTKAKIRFKFDKVKLKRQNPIRWRHLQARRY